MKRWKKIFTKTWGVDTVPCRLTKDQAVRLSLLGPQAEQLALKMSKESRAELLRQLSIILDLGLTLNQQRWCVEQLGIPQDNLEANVAMKKDVQDELFERYAGDKPKLAGGTSTAAAASHTPLVTPAVSSSSVGASSSRMTKYPYDSEDWEGEWHGVGASSPTTSTHTSSWASSPSEHEKKRMRKLPYRPGPYEFPRWAKRHTFERTIVVGDLHGCADELLELLDYVQFHPDKDLLVSCGDIVDRGPKISECYEILREYEAFVALGNHEEPFLKWLFFETHPDYREKWGGKNNPINLTDRQDQSESLRQLKKADWADMMKQQLFIKLDWLMYDPLVVHAGLFPNAGKHAKKTPEEMDPFSILRMINLDSSLETVPFYGTSGTPWWDLYDKTPGPYHVIYGHSTEKKFARIRKYSTGLDGGACYGGALTALVIDGEKDGKKGANWNIYSVHARTQHYVGSASEISGGQNFTFGKVK